MMQKLDPKTAGYGDRVNVILDQLKTNQDFGNMEFFGMAIWSALNVTLDAWFHGYSDFKLVLCFICPRNFAHS